MSRMERDCGRPEITLKTRGRVQYLKLVVNVQCLKLVVNYYVHFLRFMFSNYFRIGTAKINHKAKTNVILYTVPSVRWM